MMVNVHHDWFMMVNVHNDWSMCSQGGHVCLIAIFVGSSFLVALFVTDLGVVVNLIGAVSGAFLLIFVRRDPTTQPLSDAPSLHITRLTPWCRSEQTRQRFARHCIPSPGSFLHVSRFRRRLP